MIPLVLMFISLLPFLWIYFRDKRTLWLGFWFIMSFGAFCTILGLSAYDKGGASQIIIIILTVFAGLLILTLILLPFILISALIYSGFMLIKKEGINLVNSLSLLLFLGMIFFFVIGPFIIDWLNLDFVYLFYSLCATLFFYIFIISGSYFLTNILNFLHLTPMKADYLVVLGAGLIGEEVTPLLASRINRAIRLYKKANHPVKIIMSGGQGPDEEIAEGVAMARYAFKQGIPTEDIIIEDKAVNTYENIQFSRNLMDGENPKFAIVTNHYHVLRALLIAREQKIPCEGYGARTKLYFSINAFIREMVGYFVMKKRIHLFVFYSLLLLYMGGFILKQLMFYFIWLFNQ